MSHRTRVRHQRPHTVPDQRALLAAATRRTPVCDPRAEELTRTVITSRSDQHPAPQPTARHARVAEPSHLTGRDDREIRFDDLPPKNPDLLSANPRHLLADEHVTHHQLPHGFELCTVPLIDPTAALCDEIELMIARFACAVSDLAVLPGGARLLTSLMAAYAAGPLSAYDHRPLAAPVGHELRAPSGCCPECGNRFELDKGQIPTHYPTGDPRPCRGAGSEPEGSAR